MKRLLFTFALGVLLPNCLHAQVVITEVMYDVEGTDTGREWIEVRNDGPESVDLSTWKLFEANTNHKITTVGNSMLAVGGFAIIADVSDKFKADHTAFQGLVFDSAFSLNNAGETIILRDSNGTDSDSVSYVPEWGAGGDTFSLQKTSDGRWVSALPTTGSQTVAIQSETAPTVDLSGSNTSASSTGSTNNATSEFITYAAYSSQAIANTSPDDKDLEVSSGRTRLGFVGIPLEFRARVKKNANTLLDLEHAWSMGDGASKYGTPISYAYRFPGDYTVILNSRTKETEAVSRTVVKIVQPEVNIVSANSDFIEISNAGEYEINLGGMMLRTNGNRAVISQDTIVKPHSSIRLPSTHTKLGTLRDFIALNSSLGDTFASLPIMEDVILLPEGMTVENIRTRFEEALKTYEK